MAVPVTVMAARISAGVLADERSRKGAVTAVAAILSPVLLVILFMMGTLSGTTRHNQDAVRTVFDGGPVPDGTPEAYKEFVTGMQECFSRIGSAMEEVQGMVEDGEMDRMLVRSIFYALFYDQEGLPVPLQSCREFVDCFVRYEERTRQGTDEDGNTTEETYMVAIPLTSQVEIYSNIGSRIKGVDSDDQVNAMEIYHRMVYGVSAPTEGDGFGDWSDWAGGLTPEEYEAICRELPEGAAGSQAVQIAMTRLGDPYSQERRGQENYTDCSYLTMWVYRKLGVRLPGTAAEQGRYCVEQGLAVPKSNLVPGDLVFWSHKPNGRYMDITHVGVYAGDGMVVDASYSKGKVVYRNLFDADKQVLYGRPALLSNTGRES